MPVEQIGLDEYVAREDHFERTGKLLPSKNSTPGVVPPPPIPGQLPTPPGGQELGWYGRGLESLVQQAREGTGLSSEQLAEVRAHPGSLKSMVTYLDWLNAAIMINRGAGPHENLNWRIVPGEEWNAMKVVQEPMVGSGGEVIRPSVRQDEAGNYFEYQGKHAVQGQPDEHIIAIPVEGPTGSEGWKQRHADWMKEKTYGKNPESGLPGEFQPSINADHYEIWKKLSADQKKFYLDEWKKGNAPPAPDELNPPNTPPDQLVGPPKDNPQDLGPLGSGPTKKWTELSPEMQEWFKKHYGYKTDEFAEQEWDGSLKDPAHKNYLDPTKAKNKLSDYFPEDSTEEDYWAKYHAGELPGQKGPPEKGPPSPNPKPSSEEVDKFFEAGPPEGVGPVDWNWYDPVGGKNPPYQPPDEPLWRDPPDISGFDELGSSLGIPPGWAGEDIGAHPAKFWERFEWEPPGGGLIDEPLPPEIQKLMDDLKNKAKHSPEDSAKWQEWYDKQHPPEELPPEEYPPDSPDFPGPNRWDYQPPPE